MKKLQIIQNKAMRFVLGCDRYTKIDLMLTTLQWQTIKQRVMFNTLLFFYKIKNNLLPRYLTKNIQYVRECHKYNTRRADDFKLPVMIKASSQNSLFYKGVNMFNNLPEKIKKEEQINLYKKLLNDYVKKNF